MSRIYRVSFTEDAEGDLDAILAYRAEHGTQDDAIALLADLIVLTDSFCHFPERGNVPKELEALGISEFRQLIRKPYRIFYQVGEETVDVLLVADGRRDLPALLNLRLLNR